MVLIKFRNGMCLGFIEHGTMFVVSGWGEFGSHTYVGIFNPDKDILL